MTKITTLILAALLLAFINAQCNLQSNSPIVDNMMNRPPKSCWEDYNTIQEMDWNGDYNRITGKHSTVNRGSIYNKNPANTKYGNKNRLNGNYDSTFGIHNTIKG